MSISSNVKSFCKLCRSLDPHSSSLFKFCHIALWHSRLYPQSQQLTKLWLNQASYFCFQNGNFIQPDYVHASIHFIQINLCTIWPIFKFFVHVVIVEMNLQGNLFLENCEWFISINCTESNFTINWDELWLFYRKIKSTFMNFCILTLWWFWRLATRFYIWQISPNLRMAMSINNSQYWRDFDVGTLHKIIFFQYDLR